MKWLYSILVSFAVVCMLYIPFSSITSKNQTIVAIQETNNNQAMVIKNEQDSYSIIVIVNNLSTKEIEKKALEIASRLANDKGFTSYTVTSKEKVHIIVGKTEWPSSYNFSQNLYEEVIVQRNYDYKRSIEQGLPDNTLREAYLYKIELTNKNNSKNEEMQKSDSHTNDDLQAGIKSGSDNVEALSQETIGSPILD
jgi:hypothetical protein